MPYATQIPSVAPPRRAKRGARALTIHVAGCVVTGIKNVGNLGASCAGPTAAAAEDNDIVFAAAAADSRGVGTGTKNVGIVTGDNGIKIVGIVSGFEPGRAGPHLLGI